VILPHLEQPQTLGTTGFAGRAFKVFKVNPIFLSFSEKTKNFVKNNYIVGIGIYLEHLEQKIRKPLI
jgi:hypothetical protein